MGQRIVHVDDQPDYYDLVERAFRALAPTVGCKPFDRARDAVDHLQACAPGGFLVPSLVLVDRIMPDLDGFEVVRAARAMPHLATVPIYILSEKRLPEHVIEATNAGADVRQGGTAAGGGKVTLCRPVLKASGFAMNASCKRR